MATQAIVIMILTTLIEAMKQAFCSVIGANLATEQEQRNMELGNLGGSLIKMGAINIAATILVVIWPGEMPVIVSVILCFIVVSGLAGITIGMFLLPMANPMHYHRLALVMLWASCVSAAFAIGVLLVVSFSLA